MLRKVSKSLSIYDGQSEVKDGREWIEGIKLVVEEFNWMRREWEGWIVLEFGKEWVRG